VCVEYQTTQAYPDLAVKASSLQQLFHATDNFGRRHFQNSRDLNDDADAGAVDTAFDQADVGPVQTAVEGQSFLRNFLALPDFSERQTECLLGASEGLLLLSRPFVKLLRQQD
jgi:hypothetical protein